MLLNLREYHRTGAEVGEREKRGLDRALALLARPDIHTVPLAGGDTLVGSGDRALADDRRIAAVVDLQGLGLDEITGDPGGPLQIGAMATRAALAANEAVGLLFDGIVAAGARAWGGSLQRNRATIGGAVATAAADDPLVTALLAADAGVVLYEKSGSQQWLLADFLPRRAALLAAPALITRVVIGPQTSGPQTGGTGAALARVARTPADTPIVVAAAALSLREDRCVSARLALGGVAAAPLRLEQAEQMLEGQKISDDLIAAAAERVNGLVAPEGDFRGSADYRRAMAGVLSKRALAQAWARAA